MNTAVEISLLAEAEFSGYKENWDKLLEGSDLTSYFLTWEWLYSFWLSLYDINHELRIYTFKVGTKLVGILPLYLHKSFINGFWVRKLHFLGDGVASDRMDLICLPGYHKACCDLFYRDVFIKKKNNFDMIEFQSMCDESYLLEYFKEKEKSHFLKEIVCPKVVLPETYKEYLDRYNSRKRNRIKKRSKKIYEDFESVEIEYHSLKHRKDLLDTLFDLHKKRSDVVRNGKSSFCNNYRKEFNTFLCENCENESVFFSIVKINGKIASILYLFLYKRNLYYYQNGWLPKYADYSIGMFHLYETIEYAIGKGYLTFDLLRGDEPYKYKLKGEESKTYTFTCFSRSFLGIFYKYLYSLSKKTKYIIKRSLLMI